MRLRAERPVFFFSSRRRHTRYIGDWSSDVCSSDLVAAVHRHDAGAAEAEVVLEGDLGAFDLAGVGLAAQLPDQLGALGEAGGAERVALGEQAAGGVGDELAAVGVVAVPDELLGLAFLA